MARLVILLLSIWLLSACQNVPVRNVSQSCNQQFADNWQVTGRIKIIANKKTTVRFFWHQQGQEFDIVLLGIFGEQLAQVTGSARHAQVIVGTQSTISTDNIVQTLYEQTGWYFPVEQLKFWLTIQAAGSNFIAEYSANGCFSKLTEDGYTIFYPSVYTQDNTVLARKIIAVNQDIELHFSLSKWTLNNTSPSYAN
jgi:outer membrane lipoprotein LolB